MTEPPARRIGRYEIAALLGRGGMAEVYRARDPQLGREVAVKLILPALAGEEDFGRRFASEARAVAKLAHPNIVQIYDIGSAEAGPYLVMEFVPGGTLKERLKAAGGPLPYDEVARIARAIGLALDEAHARGVIHRDVKPANILFRADGAPVLTDFGIARIANTTQITASSALTGTPAYMAPEQVTGHPVPQSDLYSLGVALFEMLTGRLPFTAETATEMAVKHLQAEPPSPLTIRPSLPPAIDGVLRMALAKDPARRYPTGETLAAAVEAALGVAAGAPAAAPAGNPPTVRGLPAAVAVVLAALAGRRFEPSARPGRLGRIVSAAGLVSLVMAAVQTVLSSVETLSNALILVSRSIGLIAAGGLMAAIAIALRLAWVSPRHRAGALAAASLLGALGIGWAGWQLAGQARPPRGPVVVVAEFKQCPGCPYDASDDAIYNDLLRYADARRVPVEVRRARTVDHPQVADTRAARALGAAEQAAVVIWGFHTAGAVSPQFEAMAGAPADANELRSFGYRLESADAGLPHVALFALALTRHQLGDDAGALPLFNAAVDSLPAKQAGLQAGYLYFFRAAARQRTGQPAADVVADLEKARAMNPGVVEIRESLAAAYIGACKPDGSTALDLALAEIAPVLQAGQTGPRPYELDGAVLFLLGRLDEAADVYEEALRRGSASEQVRSDLEAAYRRLGRTNDADRVAALAVAAAPVTPTLPVSATIAQADQAWYAGRYPDAARLYRAAITQAGALSGTTGLVARLYRDAGWAEFSGGAWAAAVPLLEQSIALAPRVFGLRPQNLDLNYTLLANSYLKLGQADQAAAAFNRALAARPCESFALNGLARVYTVQNRPADALPILQRLARTEPDTGLAEIQIAATLASLNRPDAEINAALRTGYDKLKAWARREPGNAEAQQALRAVEPMFK